MGHSQCSLVIPPKTSENQRFSNVYTGIKREHRKEKSWLYFNFKYLFWKNPWKCFMKSLHNKVISEGMLQKNSNRDFFVGIVANLRY